MNERLERMIYLADDRNVVAKFVNGKSVPRDKDGDETAIFVKNQSNQKKLQSLLKFVISICIRSSLPGGGT